MTAGSPKIALVGHCGPDSFMLRSCVERAVDGAEIHMLKSDRAVEESAADMDLLLVNRVLDGDFRNASGIDLIRSLRERMGDGAPAMMLVSNYAEAQDEALRVGALPGFGKSELYDEQTLEKIRSAITQRA